MLVITLGDPYSINVEAVAAWAMAELDQKNPRKNRGPQKLRPPVVAIGSYWHWQQQCQALGLQVAPTWQVVRALERHMPGAWYFLDCAPNGDEANAWQQPADRLSEKTRGAIALAALEKLKQEPLLSEFSANGSRLAVVTGPIDKHACTLAGYRFPGQTEFFEDLWQAPAVMTLAGPKLRVGLVTNHLALRDVPRVLTQAMIETKLRLFTKTLRESFNCQKPRVAICAVNPHAGDGGLFGDEDQMLVAPAVQAVRASEAGAEMFGPLPADTVFYRAYQGMYDGVLAMYHDQGLGPLKTVHFDNAVNLSGGLPHLRVSPDHGPASDLYLAKTASHASWRACFEIANTYLHKDQRT